MRKVFFSFSVLILLSYQVFSQSGKSPADYVNPFIGTGGHGHTYPGVSLPFGMAQLSPDTRLTGWDGCSGYHYSDTIIYGFSHTHLSGTGCSDYGDLLLMPVVRGTSLSGYEYKSSFKKNSDHESATAGYYHVRLNSGPVAELSCTKRSGIHRYSFPQGSHPGVIVNLDHRDQVLESKLNVVAPDEIEGMRVSRAWAQKQILFFVVKFSRSIEEYEIELEGKPVNKQEEVEGKSIIAGFYFASGITQILVKVGISAVSCENARRNLEAEIPGWSFDQVVADARSAWNEELGKIEVTGGTEDQKTIFYTSLYHAFLNPNLYSDVDGAYRGRDLKVHSSTGADYYTVFSLWDTYRATHPLFTIVQQKRTSDFIKTFIKQYEQGGLLPVWELSSNETDCMIGYHAVPVIADAYMKGIRDYDSEKAFAAMKTSAQQDKLGLKHYKRYGFVPAEKEGESVSKTLEYAYDDWCIAQMAKSLDRPEDYQKFIYRAQSWKNLFDPSVGFMRPKFNCSWFSPFNPAEVNFSFTEANSWQYSFYVPQDLEGLADFHGGKHNLAVKLDSLFLADSKTTGRDQADITGLIGQYAHGNEPSHHMAYLYNYVGEPWKTQKMVHSICTELYKNSPDGLCGNEDCGQMSAWYVFSALGFYPVTPGSTVYAVGTPSFPEIYINLENHNQFRIKAVNLTHRNIYIRSAKLNGQPYNKCYIDHSDIMKGGILEFEMSDVPDYSWGTGEGNYPVSEITDELITPVPFIRKGKNNFTDTTTIAIEVPVKDATIHYSFSEDDFKIYKSPVTIDKSTKLKAFAIKKGSLASNPIEVDFHKIPKGRKIKLLTEYSSQYPAAGETTLIDFERGSDNFRTGTWQGYQGVNLEAVVDLGSIEEIRKVSVGFIQETGSWIFFPTEAIFYFSDDGVEFRKIGSLVNDIPDTISSSIIKDFSIKTVDQKTRFIKVVAVNRGVCPAGHPGEGHKAWIFADEIAID